MPSAFTTHKKIFHANQEIQYFFVCRIKPGFQTETLKTHTHTHTHEPKGTIQIAKPKGVLPCESR
jgi:hypothetical protein